MIINSFSDLLRILNYEKSLYDKRTGLKKYIPSNFQMYKTLSYLRRLRYLEYLDYKIKTVSNPILKRIFICIHYFLKQNWMRLGVKTNLDIGINSIDEGVLIYHNANGVVINENSHIGMNCEFHGNNCVGNDGIEIHKAPKIGNNVHFGVGACVLGDITIADGIWIAAGAIVVSSFLEPNIVIGGVPAKKIKNRNE